MTDETQQAFLRQAFGSSRFVYNHFLALKKSTYEESKISLSSKELSRKLTELKGLEEFSWLYNAPNVCLQQSLRNLDVAYSKFFKKQTKFPRFKKRGNKQSIKFTKECFKIVDKKLKVVNLEIPLKVVWDRKIPNDAKISSIVISKNPSDQYFVSFCRLVDFLPLGDNTHIILASS
jgi:putative transposase